MSKLGNERLRSFSNIFIEEITNANASSEIEDFAKTRQADRFQKKMVVAGDSLREKTIGEFCRFNDIALLIIPSIDSDILSNARLFIRRALEHTTKNSVPDSIQESLNLGLLLNLWRFGPGASNGVNGTHFVHKITQNMTCTSDSESLVRILRRVNPHLRDYDISNGDGVTLVEGSRLTTVPKNQDIERTIAIEPSGNMALQLAAGMYLESALRSVGLDISTQADLNKQLACRASIDGSLATLDLSHASDLITPALVQLLMPTEWYYLLDHLRSDKCTLPNGEVIKLNMMSTMGNGFTFPLMTLIILSLIYGFQSKYNFGSTNRIDYERISVFGDDIIIPCDWYVMFTDVLTKAGLIVNNDKSFFSGSFRESCGGDYYKGVLVTPFYIKSLAVDAEVYVAINQLLKWSCHWGFPVYKSLEYLLSLLHKPFEPFLVPMWSSPTSGILTTQVKSRFNMLQPKQVFRKMINHPLSLLMATSGYVTSDKYGNLVYLPRESAGSYEVVKCRMPKGYLDGHDSLYMNHEEANTLDRVLTLALS
jgi:hypothetical protein